MNYSIDENSYISITILLIINEQKYINFKFCKQNSVLCFGCVKSTCLKKISLTSICYVLLSHLT